MSHKQFLPFRLVAPIFAMGALAIVATPLSAATTLSATTLTAVKLVRETTATTTGSTTFVNVPGAVTTLTIPANSRAIILASFTAESACYGGTGWCSVRILLNGVEMDPVVGTDFAFDSSDANSETSQSWESHAVERSKLYTNTSTAAVTVTVQVQYMVTAAGMTLRLDDWHLSVMQFK
jgi:hypothetical protein